MGVTVEQNIPRGKGRQMVQVEHMAVGDVDQPLPHRQHGVIRQHREIEHHLVYIGVAVAPHAQQLGRKAVQQRNHLFVGVMLAKLGNRASVVSNFISQFNDVMMEMTMTVMKVAPVGVFCLIARTFATVGFSAFAPMLKYMGNVTLALALQCFIIYQVLLFVFTRLNPIKFVKKFLPVMGFAFSTATSNATIPMSIDTLNKKMGVSKQISSFTIPLGATINMDGTSIMQGVAVIFIAEAYGIHLTPANLATVVVTATLASIGTAGIPSVGLVTLAMVLNSVGLPTEGIALIMGIDRILDMLRTAVNITGDAVCTTIVSHQEKALNREVFNRN